MKETSAEAVSFEDEGESGGPPSVCMGPINVASNVGVTAPNSLQTTHSRLKTDMTVPAPVHGAPVARSFDQFSDCLTRLHHSRLCHRLLINTILAIVYAKQESFNLLSDHGKFTGAVNYWAGVRQSRRE